MEITQLIKASTSLSDYDGNALNRQQILNVFRGSDPAVVFSDDFTTDTGWQWQSLLDNNDCTITTATKNDRQSMTVPTRPITVETPNGQARTTEVQLGGVNRAFKIQLRLKGQEQIRFEKPWSYTWDNSNSAWPDHNSGRTDLGSGAFSNVVGIEGLR